MQPEDSTLQAAPKPEQAVSRKVSFSPSVDEAEDIREKMAEAESLGADAKTVKQLNKRAIKFRVTRRASATGSLPRNPAKSQTRKVQKVFASATPTEEAPHVPSIRIEKTGIHARRSASEKVAKIKVTKRQAVASRHAKLLESLINGSSADLGKSTGSSDAKAKAAEKKTQAERAKQLKKLKAALLDVNLANSIIGELRVMHVDPGSAGAKQHGVERVLFAAPSTVPKAASAVSPAERALQATLVSSAPRPQISASRMICLDCDETAANARHCELAARSEPQKAQADALASSTRAVGAFSVAAGTAYLASWLPWSGANTGAEGQMKAAILERKASPGDMPRSMSAMNLLSLPEVPTMMGVSPISLIMSPTNTIVAAGAEQLGAFDTLASLSGAVIQATGTNEGLAAPADRMSIFVHWWGFEIALPRPTMNYLSTAHSVSGSFLGFLSTMAISGGIPELLPFIKYVSMFVDVEFKAIAAQDRGKGVIIAAVWAFPLALVPRPWDLQILVPQPPSAPPLPNGAQPPPAGAVPIAFPITEPGVA